MAKKRAAGPCPDPLRYVLVKTMEGDYWRLARGLGKPARVNSVLQENSTHNGSTEAKKIGDCLNPYLKNMNAGRKIARLGSLLRAGRKNSGVFDFSCFKGFDVQKRNTLEMIFKERFDIRIEKGMLYITIRLNKFTIKRPGRLVTHFQFEAILMYGSLAKKGKLRTESDLSPMYSVEEPGESTCTLTLQLPENLPWMVLLKVGTYQGEKPGHYDKMYGMQVVETSFDI